MVESKNYAWNVNAVSKDVYFYFETKVNQLRQVKKKDCCIWCRNPGEPAGYDLGKKWILQFLFYR